MLLLWIMWYFSTGQWINPIPMLIGTLTPDCDIKYSPAGKVLPIWIWANHRTWTHSWQGLGIFTFPVICIDWKLGLSFAIGYLVHLGLDDCTPSGVKWIYRRKRKKLLN